MNWDFEIKLLTKNGNKEKKKCSAGSHLKLEK